MATRGRQLSYELEQLICEKYNNGVLLREIVEKSHISDATVMSVLRRNGIPLRQRKQISPEKEKYVVDLYKKGESIALIKSESGVKSEQTIYRILRDAGVERRRNRKAAE
jgi:hypothetical protein